MKLSPEQQDEIIYGDQLLQTEFQEQKRWGTVYRYTFCDENNGLWQFDREEPATEMQEFDEEDVIAWPVEEYTQIITHYRKIES